MSQFRAKLTNSQNLSAGGLEATLSAPDFDTDSVISGNRFTVPAGWDGRMGQLFAGMRAVSYSSVRIAIEVSTNAGSTWSEVAMSDETSALAATVATNPILFTTGHIYRVFIYALSTMNTSVAASFSGCIFPTSVDNSYFARMSLSANQSIAGNAFDKILFDTSDEDPDSLVDTGNNQITIPAVWTPCYGIYTARASYDSFGRSGVYAFQTKGGGASGVAGNAQDIADDQASHQVCAGVVYIEADDIFYARVFNGGVFRNITPAYSSLDLFAWR